MSSPLVTTTATNMGVEDPIAEIARLKRTIHELQESISKPNKRPPSMVTLGRGLRRVASLFQDLPVLVQEADRRDGGDDGFFDDEDSVDPESSAADRQRKRDRLYGSFLEVVRLVPSFRQNLLSSDSEGLNSYYSTLTRGANDARSDDISTIKKLVATWLNKNHQTVPSLIPEDRANRGIKHDMTGMLLCPIEYDWNDLDVRANLRGATEGFDISSSFYVRALYKSRRGDPENVEEGFLRSSLLIKTYSAIFMSPSSANHVADEDDDENISPSSSSKATKCNVAQKLNLESVTPRSIAYAAVMLLFSLTDAPQWKPVYNGFSYEHFYNFIIDFFEDVQGLEAKARVKALLVWWNKQIFPTQAAVAKTSRASIKKLNAQRARREV
ncbi:hypothetical protein H0H93_000271 [Arthromyces matolae]|nr:hypothetical protein H0H93_000271 [Arthromyces matolae]